MDENETINILIDPFYAINIEPRLADEHNLLPSGTTGPRTPAEVDDFEP